jgi:hypothetical protein
MGGGMWILLACLIKRREVMEAALLLIIFAVMVVWIWHKCFGSYLK